MLTLIRGARAVDPGKLNQVVDVFIDGGQILEVRPHEGYSGPPDPAAESRTPDLIVDAAGKVLIPGLIDLHVHLREPGHEYKETIFSGTRAAAWGGFTAVCAMPNTLPVNDSRQVTEFIIQKAAEAGHARVYPVAAISPGLAGKGLNEFSELKEAGAVAVSDDGRPVMDSQLMRRAMEYAHGCGLLVISHCEELSLAGKGVMNEGRTATRLGLAGIPNAAESVMVARDIALCELTGARLHIAHVSTRQSVDLIRKAKKSGIPVTAETAPHYFALTEEAVREYNTHAKMNPPLRSDTDREAVREGLADGTLDVIATDHAPHSVLEKDLEFDLAANGIIGLETSLPLGLQLVAAGVLPLETLVERMAVAPGRILGLSPGIEAGSTADLTLIDPDLEFTVQSDSFQSLSRNTPFEGWQLKGKAVLTLVGGRIILNELDPERMQSPS